MTRSPLCHRVAAEGVEVARLLGEARGDFRRRDDDRDRVTIAHRLAHRDDVRNDVRVHEAPVVVAEARQPRLDLICDD